MKAVELRHWALSCQGMQVGVPGPRASVAQPWSGSEAPGGSLESARCPLSRGGGAAGSGLWMCCEGSRIRCSRRQQKSLITAVWCQDQVGSWIGHWRSSKTSGHQRLFKFGFSFLKTGCKDVCVLGWEVKGIQGNTLPFYSQMMADT